MLRTVRFDNQLCGGTVKIHNKSADDPLFINLYRVFTKKKIPEFTFMGRHFPAEPPGVFQLAVIFWYGQCLPSPSSLCSATSPKGRGKALSVGFAASSPSGRAKNRVQRCTGRCTEVPANDTLFRRFHTIMLYPNIQEQAQQYDLLCLLTVF